MTRGYFLPGTKSGGRYKPPLVSTPSVPFQVICSTLPNVRSRNLGLRSRRRDSAPVFGLTANSRGGVFISCTSRISGSLPVPPFAIAGSILAHCPHSFLKATRSGGDSLPVASAFWLGLRITV